MKLCKLINNAELNDFVFKIKCTKYSCQIRNTGTCTILCDSLFGHPNWQKMGKFLQFYVVWPDLHTCTLEYRMTVHVHFILEKKIHPVRMPLSNPVQLLIFAINFQLFSEIDQRLL